MGGAYGGQHWLPCMDLCDNGVEIQFDACFSEAKELLLTALAAQKKDKEVEAIRKRYE